MAEPQPDIQLFNETGLDIPLSADLCQQVANTISEAENCAFQFVEVVYVDEEEIVRINREHLDRDYITDIITFRYDENEDMQEIEGTMFCCAPRIIEQAEEFGQQTKNEFLRIYIHGLLHLAGYEDKTEAQKKRMTEKENRYLEAV